MLPRGHLAFLGITTWGIPLARGELSPAMLLTSCKAENSPPNEELPFSPSVGGALHTNAHTTYLPATIKRARCTVRFKS